MIYRYLVSQVIRASQGLILVDFFKSKVFGSSRLGRPTSRRCIRLTWRGDPKMSRNELQLSQSLRRFDHHCIWTLCCIPARLMLHDVAFPSSQFPAVQVNSDKSHDGGFPSHGGSPESWVSILKSNDLEDFG